MRDKQERREGEKRKSKIFDDVEDLEDLSVKTRFASPISSGNVLSRIWPFGQVDSSGFERIGTVRGCTELHVHYDKYTARKQRAVCIYAG